MAVKQQRLFITHGKKTRLIYLAFLFKQKYLLSKEQKNLQILCHAFLDMQILKTR